MTDPRDTTRWIRRGSALGVLLIGWVFIAWQNRFHISAPVVFVCLGYLAVVTTVYNLWRTGASAVAAADDDGDSTWAKPAGALGELEREKRTLLKAIKEAEFDHQMGKLSKRDLDDMVKGYRVRAIEVIKEIDKLGVGGAGSTRDQIMREVRARLELEAKSSKSPGKQGAKLAAAEAAEPARKAKGKSKKQRSAAPAAPAESAAAATGDAAEHAAPAGDESGEPAATELRTNGALAADADSHTEAAAEQADRERSAAAAHAEAELDEAMNADSTTSVEPRRPDPAKEATP
jgi:hypothetical protein